RSTETDETRFLLADRLGSARTIADNDGNVVARQRFTAFGKRETALEPSAGHRGFTGHEHDQDLGLVNMRGRMYDPAIGRFLSIDPILHTPFASQGTNAYSYVYNNPLSFRDPSGLSPDNVQHFDFSDCPMVIHIGPDGKDTGGDAPCPSKPSSSGSGGNGNSTSASQGTTGSGNQSRPGSAETTAHQPGAAGTGDGHPGGGHPSTAPGRPGGSPHGVSYGKAGGAEEVPLVAGLGLLNTALGRWLSSFRVKASTKAALDGASLLASVFTGVTSFVADLAKKAVRAGTKALGGAFRRFRRPGVARRGLCFVAGTQVLMADGTTKAIEKVDAGEFVLADDPSDESAAMPVEVAALLRSTTDRIIHVAVDDGDGIPDGTFETTGRHPFWTENEGWIHAEFLEVGDRLADHDGSIVHIVAVWGESRETETFNLSVDEPHTYFVVTNGVSVLVHNEDPWDIQFAQESISPNFSDASDVPERWRGRPVSEAIEEARRLGRLPDGLRLDVMDVNNRRVALNSRTLYVAQQANLVDVAVNDVGPSGENRLRRMLRGSGLSGPTDSVRVRCP
ncbi:MAG: hypothetical protein MJE77_22935, partial [Proteobacteria bacterium]|nr:hypothetical protein [Pseudomonadota bacterium]